MKSTIYCAFFALAIMSGNAFANNLSQIINSGTIRIGIEGTYEPFNFVNSNGNADGFDVDVAHYIAKDMHVKPKFINTRWPSLIGGLNSNKFDVIIADMTITEERKKSVDFTNPYNATGAVLICRNDEKPMYKKSDLRGARIGAGAGTTYANVVSKIPGAKLKEYDNFPAYVQDLMNHRLDFIVNAKSLSEYVIKKHNYSLHICSEVLNKQNIGYIGMAVKKGNNKLVQQLNKSINHLRKSGEYREIYQKWFGVGTPLLLKANDQK